MTETDNHGKPGLRPLLEDHGSEKEYLIQIFQVNVYFDILHSVCWILYQIYTYKIFPINSIIGNIVSNNLFCLIVSSNSPPSKDTDLKIYPVRKLPPSDQPAKEIERLQREMESYLQQIQVIEQRALRGKQTQYSFKVWILDQSATVLNIYQSVCVTELYLLDVCESIIPIIMVHNFFE